MEGRRRKEREADAQGLAYGGSITPGVVRGGGVDTGGVGFTGVWSGRRVGIGH